MPGFQIPGDLTLSDDGRYILLAQGPEDIASRVANGLQLVAGSWIYNTAAGMRNVWEIFEKPASNGVALLRAECWRIIAETPGVLGVVSVDVAFASTAREARVTFEAKIPAGLLTRTVVIR